MKPYQTLIFILGVFLVLLLVAWVFPEDGIQVGKRIHLKFATVNEYLTEDTVKYADISDILESSVITETEDESDDYILSLIDTLASRDSQNRSQPETGKIRKISYSLEYKGDDPQVLFPFFRKLKDLRSSKKLVRILHYGDSQIEADRISSFIRNRLQVIFGGSGCGTVPAVPLYNGQLSVKQDYSDNWTRHTFFTGPDSAIDHEKYGALMSFVKQAPPDSSPSRKNESWLSFSTSPLSYKTTRNFSDVSLYAESELKPVSIYVFNDNSLVDSVRLKPSQGLKKLKWHFKETPEELKFSFSGPGNADIYGVSLDNSWGVALDNIPLRGSSGLVFSRTDTVFLSGMYRMMDVGLVILQFGGNVVPYMTEKTTSFQRYFSRELNVIKSLLPGVPVVVIGPSDMSYREKDIYLTYPGLEGVRDAMRQATLEAGFVFWDMYEAMGGKNSMPAWVIADPPLAVPDYVHFSARGAKVIAGMFTNALLNEYNHWYRTYGSTLSTK
jgi:hypothetical protein